MNIVDSSGWLEYFADGPNASFFSSALERTAELVVPTITIYEVFKAVLRQRGESDALQSVSLMQQGSVVDLTPDISILAAKTSVEDRLPMADSIILATSRVYKAIISTQDSDFEEIDGVQYVRSKSGSLPAMALNGGRRRTTAKRYYLIASGGPASPCSKKARVW